MFDIHFLYALDILIVALLIYLILIFIKQSRSYFIVYGFAVIFLVDFLAKYYNLGLTRRVLDRLLSIFLILCAIIFQREIRRFFRWLVLSRARLNKPNVEVDQEIVEELTRAIWTMAQNKIGALLVFSGEFPLDDIIEGGFSLQGMISSPLLLSIFDNRTPGHDGAMLIENREIKKFGVHLPLGEDFKQFRIMGTRHRAAIGITERTDALAIIVSEERGDISLAEGGVLKTLPDKKSLEHEISRFIKDTEEKKSPFHILFSSNLFLKILALVASVSLWFVFVFHSNVITEEYKTSFEFQHLNPGLEITTVIPSELDLKINGNADDLASLKDDDIRAAIDLNDVTAGKKEFIIKIEDIIHPPYVTLYNYEPISVSVTLTPIPPAVSQ